MGAEIDVLQVITSTDRRGAERFAVGLHPQLERRGLSVRTVALTAGESAASLDVDPLGPSRLGPSTIRALRRLSRSAAVVVAHGSTTLPASFLATGATSTPFVYRSIGDPRHWATGRLRRARTRLLLSRAATVVALTPTAADVLAAEWGVPADRIVAIPNAVPADQFPLRTATTRQRSRRAHGLRDDQRVAVYLGALSPEKDVATAIRAFSGLPERWLLLVAGDGPDRLHLVDESRRVAGDRVRLIGPVADPAQLLAAADLLVLPSLTEGLPGVIIEAGMVGIPSVATDVGFVSEIIDHGVTGRVVPPGDPHALADAISKSEPHLARMGCAARARVLRPYSLATVADQWRDLLRPFVSQAPRPRWPRTR